MNQPWQLINFHGLNLVKSAHNQQEFLKLVDKKNFSESDIKRAIYRYEKHWLSLCDKIFKNQFDFSKYYPPLDVAWIWHCHMLSSIHYRQDLEETFGTIFPHSCQSLNEMHLKQVQTVSLWENETGLSFDHNKPNSVDASYENFKSKFSCDLFESSKRQKSFNYQVSLPHFHSEKFLKTALERYRKLLYYNKCYPERFIVPCYAIAIIWHTHQLFPIEYNQDCCKILGRIFPHDNSVNDRLQDSKPGTCIFNYGKYHNYYSESFTPWKITFREDFFFSGGMYRGSEPNEIKYKTSNDLNLQDYKFLRSANFRIDELTLNNEKRILLISLFRSTNELIISDEILTNKFKTDREIVFDESETRLILKINLKDKFIEQFINVIKIGHRSSSKNSINLDVSLEMPIKNENLTKEQTLNINFGNLNFSGYLKYSIFNVKSEKKLIKFDFVKNNFEVVDKFFIIDECKSFDLKDRLEDGEVKKVNISGIQDRFLPMIENCVQNLENEPGLRACHSVTVRNKEIKVYDAEILHIPVLKWSSIRILYNGGCVASAHLIDSSQLPSPRQVEPTFCSLNPNRERALLVRGENGDFAIIKASWEGKKLTSWKGSFEENSGYLYVTIVELDSKSQINFNVNVHSNESFEFILCGSRVKISLRDENANLIIENENNIYTERLLCIALGISLLHVLLQPKSTLTIDQSRLKLEECRPINLIDIKKFSFLDIIGYHDLLKHKLFILMSLSRERHSIFNGWIDMFMHGLDYYFTIYIRNGGGRHSSGYSGGGHSSGYSGGGSNFVDYSGGGCYSGGGGGGGCDSGGGGGGGCDSGGGGGGGCDSGGGCG